MDKKCFVPGCQENRYPLHSFPVNENLRMKWFEAIPNITEKITAEDLLNQPYSKIKNYLICSYHFSTPQFQNIKCERLLRGVVPCIFDSKDEIKPNIVAVKSEIDIKIEPLDIPNDFLSENSVFIADQNEIKTETFDSADLFIKEEVLEDPLDVSENMTVKIEENHQKNYGKLYYLLLNKNFPEKQNSEKTPIVKNQCRVCKKKFKRKPDLERHMRTHTGIKPYKCEICDKYFGQKSALNTHKLSHTGEKTYTCNQCNASFTRKSYLIAHTRIHTGEKPYNCDVCEKAFKDKSSLNRHRLIHTEEKPYTCEICLKSYNDRSTLRRHKSKIHKK